MILGPTEVDIGDKVFLYCNSNVTGMKVQWYKDKQLLPKVNTYLHIIDAKVEDIGYYQCEVSVFSENKLSSVGISLKVRR